MPGWWRTCQREACSEMVTRTVRLYGPIRDGNRLSAALHDLESDGRVRLFQRGQKRMVEIAAPESDLPATPAPGADSPEAGKADELPDDDEDFFWQLRYRFG